MSTRRVLFVDDEPEVLKGFERQFHGRFTLETAPGGEKGLEIIRDKGPFAVVMSDYKMPAMDGVEFLAKVKDISPDSVRMILTGHADLEVAIKSVNEGQVFRFLTKPCPPDFMAQVIEDGIKNYELIQAERELQVLKKWRKGIEEMIMAFVTLLEARDPYTAGHQRRVTSLACAIAQELGLPSEKLEAVRIAAMIHDIGKMYVPAEFLNKPGRLTSAELNIIKIHPQVGFDVLKSIDFEFPISEIVYQHHERWNASGYPQGLKEDDILLEARIIAVADVVEAMNSHRPYRAALGLDLALEEITQNRDVLYDPEVVDGCRAVFQEKNFVF